MGASRRDIFVELAIVQLCEEDMSMILMQAMKSVWLRYRLDEHHGFEVRSVEWLLLF